MDGKEQKKKEKVCAAGIICGNFLLVHWEALQF